MKIKIPSAFLFVMYVWVLASTTGHAANPVGQQSAGLAFTENKGQVFDQNYKVRPDVLYGVMAGNMAVHIKKTGVSYQLYRVDKWKETEDPKTRQPRLEIDKQSIYRIDLNWLNANANFTRTEDEALPGYNNYYQESCPRGALNVKSYKGITLHNLYNGIDLHYYEKNGELKHDYIVAPNTDYKQIKLQVKGADISVNRDGSLILTTPLGKVQEGAPIVYQNGGRLKAKWNVDGNTLNFEIENYKPDNELIIDPVTRSWGTYYGTSNDDRANGCTTDALGNAYMCGLAGYSTSTIIATSGSFQSTLTGVYGSFLAKFTTAGVRLWGTYFAQNGDAAYACCTDANNDVYLVGGTSAPTSSSLIATPGCQQSFLGGSADAFVVKFNSSGVRQWGTYYGDNGFDCAFACSTDSNNNVYVAGNSTSTATSTLIASPGSHQQTNLGGGNGYDAFLVKFNSNGVRQWGTFYGGTGDEWLSVCSTDISGNIYLGGYTSSGTGTYIATPGSHQAAYGSTTTCYNAYLAKFNTNGVRQWGTYYGGSCSLAYGCATDSNGDVYLSGYANSTTGTVIATLGSHQATCSTQNNFLAKFNTNGVRQWGTWYGGGGYMQDGKCATDASNNVYLTGTTSSIAIAQASVTTPGSYQTAFGGGQNDVFLAKFNSSGVRQYGTFYGGAGYDQQSSIAVDVFGDVYLAGMTSSSVSSQIASYNGHQTTYGGNPFDAFLVKFKDCSLIYPLAASNTSVCTGAAINLSVSVPGTVTLLYNWVGPGSFTSTLQNPSIANISTVNTGVYTVYINNGGCVELSTVLVKSGDPTITVNSGTICSGNSFTITPGGAFSYTFSSGNAVVSPTITSSYSVSGSNTLGCIGVSVNTIVVVQKPVISVNSGTICSGKSFTIIPTGAQTYSYSSGSPVVFPSTTTSYSVVGASSLGCISSNTALSTIVVNPSPSLQVNNGSICNGQSFTLTATGANTYTFSAGPVVTPSVTTSYSVSGSNTIGCTTSTLINVTVNPIPTIMVSSGAVCSGSSFNLNPVGASTYTIQGGSAIVSPLTQSSYSVIGTSAAGCIGSNTAIATVSVNALPVVTVSSSNSLLCEGESATLTASGAVNYAFSNGGTGASIIISPSINTTYTILGTDANSCTNIAVVTQSVDACTGIRPSATNSFSSSFLVYPNPTSGIFKVEFGFDGKKIIAVYNEIGEIVLSCNSEERIVEIDLSNYAKGVYFANLGSYNNSVFVKIIRN